MCYQTALEVGGASPVALGGLVRVYELSGESTALELAMGLIQPGAGSEELLDVAVRGLSLLSQLNEETSSWRTHAVRLLEGRRVLQNF